MKEVDHLGSSGEKLFVRWGIIVFAVWLVSGLALWNVTDRGIIGDSFGAINALFSGLAFAGLIVAVSLQRTELRYTREELKYTRKEIAAQRKEMQLQSLTLVKQNFEDTFFSLLRLLQEGVHSLDFTIGVQNHKGRDSFAAQYKKLRNDRQTAINEKRIPQDDVIAGYETHYRRYQSDLGYYFRSLYNIFKFIDQSNIENKKFYTNLVRAQLSSFELTFLFYNCLSSLGRDKFKPLVEKYALLKNIDRSLLLNPEEHAKLYSPAAYGESTIPSPTHDSPAATGRSGRWF
ncbi:MAG: putative phage abortive infection protein [Alphaproteobacteria bacterium]|nr:putative phage abortive infection protein [Alphaproteobacteria bacterium]